MSLRVTRREGSPFWWLTGTIGGRRIRESTGTDSRKIAERKRAAREIEIERNAIHGAPAAALSFAAAVQAYLEDQPRTSGTERRVDRLVLHFGRGATCKDVTQAALEEAAKTLLRSGHSPATRLREIVAPARAVLIFAADRDWCPAPRLKVKVKQVSRTEWLTPHQVDTLAAVAKPHLRPLILFLAGTGARMSEALRLDWMDVDLTHGRAVLRETKNGSDRPVILPPQVIAALAAIKGRDRQVFRDDQGHAYRDARGSGAGGQVRRAWATACLKAGLPGQLRKVARSDRASLVKQFHPLHTPHSLRHTWATWHYAEHRDVLRLKEDGGWSELSLVERYAHTVPDSLRTEIVAWRERPAEVGAEQRKGTGT